MKMHEVDSQRNQQNVILWAGVRVLIEFGS